MIKNDLTLDVIYTKDLPAKDLRACDVVCSFGIMTHYALLFIANPDGPILRLGKRAALKFYDLDKLREDGVYVNKTNYGGSGAMFGPRDITFNLHVNKQSFVDEYRVDTAKAFRFFIESLRDTMRDLGIDAHIDDETKLNKEDGVCIHLQGRSEVVTRDGRKLVVSVYREDEMGFYLNAAVLVSDAWASIYDYLVSPMEVRLPNNSVEELLGRENITEEIIRDLIQRFSELFGRLEYIELTEFQRRAVEGIRDKYRVL